jgi:excinuclease UvrABC ATPase subunit
MDVIKVGDHVIDLGPKAVMVGERSYLRVLRKA